MYLEIADQAEQLLAASSASEMEEAARNLRLTALQVRRSLMSPRLSEPLLKLDPAVPDSEVRRAELADLAVDVVGAIDYLLGLLVTSPAVTARLTLTGEPGYGRGRAYVDEESADRLIRRRLDARGAAVRMGMHLVTALRSDVL